jgi:hypothetical protein
MALRYDYAWPEVSYEGKSLNGTDFIMLVMIKNAKYTIDSIVLPLQLV